MCAGWRGGALPRGSVVVAAAQDPWKGWARRPRGPTAAPRRGHGAGHAAGRAAGGAGRGGRGPGRRQRACWALLVVGPRPVGLTRHSSLSARAGAEADPAGRARRARRRGARSRWRWTPPMSATSGREEWISATWRAVGAMVTFSLLALPGAPARPPGEEGAAA